MKNKTWIITADVETVYDVFGAFNKFDSIWWHMSQNNKNTQVGDIVYIYITKKFQQIMFKCEVVELASTYQEFMDYDIEFSRENDVRYDNTPQMKLKLISQFDDERLSFKYLQERGYNPMGPRIITGELLSYVDDIVSNIKKPKMLFCNIGYMKEYNGPGEIKNGGSFVEENGFGHEEINFKEVDGYCYGFVESSNEKINLKRIDDNIINNTLSNVTIIWCARGDNGRTIVGYYKNATVCGDMQHYEPNSKYIGYYFKCRVEDAVLLEEKDRIFKFPQSKKGNFGRANIWYADADLSQQTLESVEKFLTSIKDTSVSQIIDYEEQEKNEILREGNQESRLTNYYERNPKLREECIKKYGYVCQVCNINLMEFYGPVAKEFIHVHHIVPISTFKEEHEAKVDDLITVCPNCHAMLHRKLRGQEVTIDILKDEIQNQKEGNVIKVGLKIYHPSFGKGEIVKIENKLCYVSFYSNQEIKSFNFKYVMEKCII